MQVILLQDVKALGKKGEMVKVSEGYARNYLIPKNLAQPANAGNINNMKTQKAAKDFHKAEEKAALKAEILAELKAAGVIPAEPAKETKADAQAKAEAEDKPGAKK